MPRKLPQRGDHGKGNRPVVTIADRCWPGLAYVTGQERTWRDYALFPAAAAGQPTPAPREPSPGIRASVPTQAKFFQHERSCRSPRGDTQPLRLSAILMSTFYPPGQRYAWSEADAGADFIDAAPMQLRRYRLSFRWCCRGAPQSSESVT